MVVSKEKGKGCISRSVIYFKEKTSFEHRDGQMHQGLSLPAMCAHEKLVRLSKDSIFSSSFTHPRQRILPVSSNYCRAL
jgi:hypothetical protein